MEPLAYALRPKTIDEIVGQKHLVGPNGAIRRLLNSNKITSLIFYGDPGIGKTTIAKAIVNTLNVKYDTFNASSDNKEKLKRLIEKDNNNNITMVKSNVIAINEIISDVAVKIQEDIDNRGRENIEIAIRKFYWI